MRFGAGGIAALLLLALSGCAWNGATHLPRERYDYNRALQSSASEQLLLNLVRLRYRDVPLFLEVASVSSQFQVASQSTAQGSITEPMRNFIQKSLNLSQQLSVGSNPTVSYQPLQGDMFVQRMLSPISLDNLVSLSNSGWSMDRVLQLCAQRLDDMPNAPTASGPTPDRAPVFREFKDTAQRLRRLQMADKIVLGYAVKDGHRVPVLRVMAGAERDADLRGLLARLHLPPGRRIYVLVGDVQDVPDSQYLTLSMRSFLSVLFYLSQAVEVPEEDYRKGAVMRTHGADGAGTFDWTELLGDVLRIHSARARPSSGFVSARYRDHWFYIDDADLESKSTFFLLTQLLALEAGSAPAGAAPVLTLPVGR